MLPILCIGNGKKINLMYSVFEEKQKRKIWSKILRKKSFITKLLFLFFLTASHVHGCEKRALSTETMEEVFEKQVKGFRFMDERNPKLLILFSGTPGMGKTTLAKRLEDHFHGLRLNLDGLREIQPSFRYEDPLLQYLRWGIMKLLGETSNHLIILDASVDRKYQICHSLALKNGFRIFLIRMEMEREDVEERIIQRGTDVEQLLTNLNGYWKDYEEFGNKVVADYYMYNGRDADETIHDLIDQLNDQIENLREEDNEDLLYLINEYDEDTSDDSEDLGEIMLQLDG